MKSVIQFIGNGHFIRLDDKAPEWSNDDEPFFRYRGNDYFLSEFLRCHDIKDFEGFDGYATDTYFSGVAIKLVTDDYLDECVKVYRFFSKTVHDD